MSNTDTSVIDIPDVTARGVRIQVVAVKWPGHWILRGIFAFKSMPEIIRKIQPYLALIPTDELEWSEHEYMLPHYLAYGDGDLPRIGWPGQGVFLFEHQDHDTYGSKARKLD